MLEPGDPAPDVTAHNQHGESVTPDFTAPTVVYFYPKDFTGGCTIEAADFQATLPEFRGLGVAVYGVSMDDVETHADFAAEEGVQFDLLADPDGAVASAFGVSTDGGHTDRVTFLIGNGDVVATYDPAMADPDGHARDVLDDARQELGIEE